MKLLAQLLSWLALAGTLLLPCLFFMDKVSLAQFKVWLLVAAVGWFVAAPFWMEHRTGE